MTLTPAVPVGGGRDLHPPGTGGPQGLSPRARRVPASPEGVQWHRGPPQHPQDHQPQVHCECLNILRTTSLKCIVSATCDDSFLSYLPTLFRIRNIINVVVALHAKSTQLEL